MNVPFLQLADDCQKNAGKIRKRLRWLGHVAMFFGCGCGIGAGICLGAHEWVLGGIFFLSSFGFNRQASVCYRDSKKHFKEWMELRQSVLDDHYRFKNLGL